MFFYYTIQKRFLELLFSELILSAIFNALFRFELLPSTKTVVCTAVFLALAIFLCINIFMLRSSYKRISNDAVYFIVNAAANGLFALVNLLVYFIFNKVVYTWVFSLLKAVHYAVDSGRVISALAVHLVLFLLIFVSPWGIRVPKEEDMII